MEITMEMIVSQLCNIMSLYMPENVDGFNWLYPN